VARIGIEALRKAHGEHEVLRGISLEIADGELLVLVGPSGCGKSTLLRCIAGLDEPTAGRILLDGTDVTHAEPRDRDLAMVFQSYALYPHLTVRDNLGFGLKMRKTPRAELDARVAEAADMLGIAPLLDRLPRQLSGGQRQRVAMGRAVVRRPKAFLFDEPLSNLDAALRGQVRLEIARLRDRLKATMVYVTHDQVEAMTLADRIAILDRGVLQQLGEPRTLYRRPANLFVARFLGTPEMSTGAAAEAQATHLVGTLPAGAATIGVRAEDLVIGAWGAAASVEAVEELGWESLVHMRCGGLSLCARVASDRAPKKASEVQVSIAPGGLHVFGADGARLESA
jgi:sn-glycerol 3-phosphate transport system ATP-binding protein/multiple sugar transport system ATP-binding protein